MYYAITAISGYEFGLIAIVVGFGVGTAVRWGSNGRGGKRYQALAMALTYLAIVATYIPPIVQGFREGAAETSAVEPVVADGASSAVPAAAAAPSEITDPAEGEPTGEVPTVIAVVLILRDCLRGAIPRGVREHHRHRDYRHRVVRGLEAEPANDCHHYRPARDLPQLGGNDWRMSVAAAGTAQVCSGCGTELGTALLSCPMCRRLVHASALKDLAERAEAAAAAGDAQAALAAWRSSLELLPPDSRQSAAVAQRIAALGSTVDAAASAPVDVPTSGRWKWLAALGPAGLLIWKFKFLVVALLTKGKLLLLGLTKAGTVASMFASVGLYGTQWGLWFALGLVLSIYVHEMGHVAAIRRYGIAATAPMFIPGFGALVRLKQAPVTPRENARIGLAGPIWGLGASVAAALAGQVAGSPLAMAIAHTGAWINILNLAPVWQLDGSRGFASLTRPHRWIATAALAVAWMLTRDGVVLLVLLVAVGRTAVTPADAPPDRGALILFVFVTLALAVIWRLTAVSSPLSALS